MENPARELTCHQISFDIVSLDYLKAAKLEYGGWKNPKLIEFYRRLVTVLFTRFRGLVHYWLTFNEINMILHLPFMGAGLVFEPGENETQTKYLAAHHELIASARATKIAHEIDPENKVGCMLAAGMTYPYSCNPEDVWKGMEKDRESYFFIDVQSRGTIPPMRRNSSRGSTSSWSCRRRTSGSYGRISGP